MKTDAPRVNSNGNSGGILGNMIETSKLTRPNILLVEDHVVNVMVSKWMLISLNQDMDVVNNGVEFVWVVKRCDYGLILMDVCMPLMDGLQATWLIWSYEKTDNWEEASLVGFEFSSDQIVKEPRSRIPIIVSDLGGSGRDDEGGSGRRWMTAADSGEVASPETFVVVVGGSS